jgi:Ribbon-helix-helix protein, copG family
MVGQRLPAALVARIDSMAAEIGTNRSVIMRMLIEHALEYGSPHVRTFRSVLVSGLLGWKGRGCAADKIARDYLAALKGSKGTKPNLRRPV